MIQGGESFRLVVRRGPQPNQTYELNKDIITLGRDITNDIVINDPEVSRHHMRMTRGPGGFTIEDLGSTNGTFVNGQRVTGARPLRAGDMIGLGETVTLGYESLGAAAAAQPGQPAAPGAGQSPFQPPAAGVAPMGDQPAQQGYNAAPYQQPAQGQSPYQPPAANGGQQQPYAASYTPGNSGSSSGYQPPPAAQPYTPANYSAGNQGMGAVPGYAPDYDPQAVRTEDPRNTTRWVLIGCAGLGLFCCCSTVLSLVIVDTLCLWDRIPILWDVLRALGVGVTCLR